MLSRLKNNRAKFREWYVSFLAGLFSGLILGYLFAELKFFQGEVIYNLIIIIAVILLWLLMYYSGKIIAAFMFGADVIFDYKINFFAGTMSSLFAGLFIQFQEYSFWIALIMIMFVVAFAFIIIPLIKRKNKKIKQTAVPARA